MWDTIIPNFDCSWEPVELRILKQELANMVCKCNACVALRNPSACLQEHVQCYDEGVQVDQKNVLLNQYIYANDFPDPDEPQPNMTGHLNSNAFCPNCYFLWDLLRRAKKVFRDESSETKSNSSDKATGKVVKFVDSTTSVTDKPVLRSSNISLCDFLSDGSCGSASQLRKKSNHERVTFLEEFPHVHADKVKTTIANTMQGNCLCLENFVDSIRPTDFDYHNYY